MATHLMCIAGQLLNLTMDASALPATTGFTKTLKSRSADIGFMNIHYRVVRRKDPCIQTPAFLP